MATRPLDFIRHKIRERRKARQRGRERTGTLLKWVWYSLFAFLILVLASAVSLTVFLIVIAKDLPSPQELLTWNVAQSTKIFDRNGGLLYEIHGDERRTVITLADMPQYLVDATLAAEDAGFYDHPGYSWKSIIRAAVVDVERKITGRGNVQGASTITQQFVKNTYLSPEKTITRKLKELILAMEVENYFTKDQILEMYLNKISYGSNAYGVESAAQLYFGKNTKDLTLAQSAVLAAMPQAPSYYSPYGSHQDDLMGRKDWVLDRMVELGKVTFGEAELAKQEEITFLPYRENIEHAHFVFYVREELEKLYPKEVIEQGGFQVYTTLDPTIQDPLEEQIQAAFEKEGSRLVNYGATNSAGLALDPKTGQILAMVGSRDYFDTDHDGQVNVTTSRRQPGSSMKPYVYAAAFLNQKQIGPGTVTYDLRTNFGSGYEPENFEGGYWGPMTLRRALAGSRNIPAIKALVLATSEKTYDLIHKMGIESITKPEAMRAGLSWALGTIGVTMLEHAHAYGVFATGGMNYPTTPFLKILDSSGQVLYEFEQPDGEEALDPQVAYLISDMLSDNGARPSGWGNLTVPGFRVAVKTGTSSKEVNGKSLPLDIWTVGYTPNLVLAVWAGNNDGTPLTLGADGLMGVAPIWKDVLTEVLPKRPVEDFVKPPQIKSVAISRLSGFLPSGGTITTDLFTDYGVPTLVDKGFLSARVDSTTGELATPFCPEYAIVTYVYENRHDMLYYLNPEHPQNERWEGPVRAWARGHIGALTATETTSPEGEGTATADAPKVIYVDSPGQIPTATCHLHNEHNQGQGPTVTILSPTNVVVGQNEVRLSIDSENGVERVELYFDDLLADTISNSSVSSTIEGQIVVPAGTAPGSTHMLKAYVYDRLEQRGESTISVTVVNDNAAPEVEIRSPGSFKRYDIGDDVEVDIDASDNLGVSKVEVWMDASLLQTLSGAPYQFTFTIPQGTASGEHTLMAKGFDSDGNVGIDTQEIRVSSGGGSEPVEDSSPLSGNLSIDRDAVAVTESTVTFHLRISGDIGNVDRVNFYANGSRFLSLSNPSAENDVLWEVADDPGVYSISAKIIDQNNNEVNVPGVNVTVTP